MHSKKGSGINGVAIEILKIINAIHALILIEFSFNFALIKEFILLYAFKVKC